MTGVSFLMLDIHTHEIFLSHQIIIILAQYNAKSSLTKRYYNVKINGKHENEPKTNMKI